MVIFIDRKKEQTHCFLCNNNYDKNSHKPKCLIPCGHTYCKACISTFDKKTKKCPRCIMYYNQIIPDYEMIDIIISKKIQPGLVDSSKSKSDSIPEITVIENEKIENKKYDEDERPVLKLQNSIRESPRGKNDQEEKKLKPEVIHLIMEGTKSQQLMGVKFVRKILSDENNPPIDEIIKSGLVLKLTELLKSNDSSLQFESAWALTNIVSGNSEQTKCVVDTGAVPVFISLISSQFENIQEQSIWALGNIAGDGAEMRDLVIDQGILEPLIKILNGPKKGITFMRNSSWCLSNLCRGKPSVQLDKIKPIVSILNKLLIDFESDDGVVQDTLWTISYLSDGDNDRIQFILENIDLELISKKLSSKDHRTVIPALRIFGNIASGTDQQTQIILELDVLSYLKLFLTNSNRTVLKETCWTLSNITAGTRPQIQKVIDYELFPKIIELAQNGEFKIKKEALWIIANAFSGGSEDQLDYLCNLNVLMTIRDNLKEIDDNAIRSLCLCVLESLNEKSHNVFKKSMKDLEIVEAVESLIISNNKEISEKANKILEVFVSDSSDYELYEENGLDFDDDKDVIS